MYPDLIDIGGFKVASFGVFMALPDFDGSQIGTSQRAGSAMRYSHAHHLTCPTLHEQTFTWTNPVTGGPDWICDAHILRAGDHDYLTGPRRIASDPDEP